MELLYVRRHVAARSRNHCCHGKAISITYSCVRVRVCVWVGVDARERAWAYARVALLNQQATRRRHIMCGLIPPHFSTLSHKRHDFREWGGKLQNTKYVFWFSVQLLFETFLILKRYHWGTVINVKTSSSMVHFIFPDFNKTLIISTDFRKSFKYQI